MMSLWDALRMNMMISYQELVRTFPKEVTLKENISASSITWKIVNDYGGAGSLYSSSL